MTVRTTILALIALLAFGAAILVGFYTGSSVAATAENSQRLFERSVAPNARPDDVDTETRLPGTTRLYKVRATGQSSGYAPLILRRAHARHRAIAQWRRHVIARYGRAYTSWWNANAKSVDCTTLGRRVTCNVVATPARTFPVFGSYSNLR